MMKDCMDACCMSTWKGAANAGGWAINNLGNPADFDSVWFWVFNAAVDPVQPLVDSVSEHKPGMAHKGFVVVCLALDWPWVLKFPVAT